MSEIEDIGEIVEEEVSEMTDKERAEFINETTEKICDWLASEKSKIKQAIKEGLEKGLTEGRKEGFDAGYKKATERAYERQQDLTDTYIKDGEKIKQLEKENAELRKGLTRTRIDKCVKKHLTSDMSDMTKKEFPAVPCYEVNNCWLCNIYKEATNEQH